MPARIWPARLAGILGLLLALNACNFPVEWTSTEPPQAPAVTASLSGGEVLSTSTNSPTPTPTQGAVSSLAGASIMATQEVESCIDRAAFISDVTITDNSEFFPGEIFVKVWRLENTGTCTWTSEYHLSFFGGDRMEGEMDIPLEGEVAPGDQVELSVELEAPQHPGAYQGFWKLRNAQSAFFGIGPTGDLSFWVKIVVVAPPITATPTPSITRTELPPPSDTPTPTRTPTGTPSATSD